MHLRCPPLHRYIQSTSRITRLDRPEQTVHRYYLSPIMVCHRRSLCPRQWVSRPERSYQFPNQRSKNMWRCPRLWSDLKRIWLTADSDWVIYSDETYKNEIVCSHCRVMCKCSMQIEDADGGVCVVYARQCNGRCPIRGVDNLNLIHTDAVARTRNLLL